MMNTVNAEELQVWVGKNKWVSSPVPFPVEQLAAQYQLGQPQQAYPLQKPNSWGCYMFLLVWWIMGIGIVSSTLRRVLPADSVHFLLIFALGFCFLPPVILLLLTRRSRTRRVDLYMCSGGLLVFSNRDREVALRWDQVEEFQWGWDDAAEQYTPYVFSLYGGGTQQIKVPDVMNSEKPYIYEAIGKSCENALEQTYLPGIQARLQAGQEVSLDPFHISRQGISLGQGRTFVPWGALEQFRITRIPHVYRMGLIFATQPVGTPVTRSGAWPGMWSITSGKSKIVKADSCGTQGRARASVLARIWQKRLAEPPCQERMRAVECKESASRFQRTVRRNDSANAGASQDIPGSDRFDEGCPLDAHCAPS